MQKLTAASLNTHTMSYLTQTCKIGQGAECCRYIVAGKGGITCAKLTSVKATIDNRVAAGSFTAKADNCQGKEENIDLSKLEIKTNENHPPLTRP
jgi:hypothetical protein